jgi:hypothetical protein
MEKKNRLILHIGTPKTGSTSIQESLGTSRNVLLKHNIHYPTIRPYNHIFNFIPIFLDDPQISFVFKIQMKPNEDKSSWVEKFRSIWIKEILSCKKDNFIISAEDFTLPYFNKNAVERLKGFIEQYFHEVTIIVYVRHYDQWISSQVQQAIRNGNNNLELGKLVQSLMKCPPRMAYRKLLKRWIDAFGKENLVVRPFDPQAFYQGSLLADFFHSSNLPVDTNVIPEIRSNESIGKNAALFLQKYNQLYPRIVNKTINPKRGLSRGGFHFDLYRDIPDEKFKLDLVYTTEQADKFNEEIDFVNRFFSNGYQFHRITPEDRELEVPDANDIPIEFFVELINNYNKKIEYLQSGIPWVQIENRLEQTSKFKFPLTLVKMLRFLWEKIFNTR